MSNCRSSRTKPEPSAQRLNWEGGAAQAVAPFGYWCMTISGMVSPDLPTLGTDKMIQESVALSIDPDMRPGVWVAQPLTAVWAVFAPQTPIHQGHGHVTNLIPYFRLVPPDHLFSVVAAGTLLTEGYLEPGRLLFHVQELPHPMLDEGFPLAREALCHPQRPLGGFQDQGGDGGTVRESPVVAANGLPRCVVPKGRQNPVPVDLPILEEFPKPVGPWGLTPLELVVVRMGDQPVRPHLHHVDGLGADLHIGQEPACIGHHDIGTATGQPPQQSDGFCYGL